MADPNLVTTCTFHGQEFLFKMNVLNNNLEILVTDKSTGEEWQCSYDAIYVENLTQKTGNFKQFDIFVAMIKSGLLRTSESVSLDLLTFEDLELLRSRKITKSVGPANNNRRYLILTYIVEFDKIRYPLPLDYCGPPDPLILQATIRRLEVELAKTQEELALKNNNTESKRIYFLEKRIEELTEENTQYQEEIRELTKYLDKRPKTQIISLQRAVTDLEKSVVSERNSHHELVQKLQIDNRQLTKELERIKCSECSLRKKLSNVLSQTTRASMNSSHSKKSAAGDIIPSHSVRTMFRRPSTVYQSHLSRDRSSSGNLTRKNSETAKRSVQSLRDISRSSSENSTNKFRNTEETTVNRISRSHLPAAKQSQNGCCYLKGLSKNSSENSSFTSSRPSSRQSKNRRSKKIDYKKLEEQIEHLQKMLKSNMTTK